ncbi:MAG: hypothetical protein IPJ82_15790 [Lewinellaceae bacterium]|nr:hypothetical protein [Lewinellaceae bacterium]
MTMVLLFDNPDRLLSDEWLASAVGIAITYFVFIMGVPALIFQTFIADSLRNLYNERLGRLQPRFILFQIFLILFLFIQSNGAIFDLESVWVPVWFISGLILLAICIILFGGYYYLIRNFNSTRNIEQQLSEKIVNDAIRHFEEQKKLNKKDLEDLGLLARELPAGRIKNIYLEQCERLVEFLLNVPAKDRDTKLIGEILEDAVCLSVTYDGAQVNNENMRKVLDILILTYSYIHRNGKQDDSNYLNTTIGNCMKEIGIKAMLKNDLPSVMDAVEKLSAIESTSREMFVLGNELYRRACADGRGRGAKAGRQGAQHHESRRNDQLRRKTHLFFLAGTGGKNLSTPRFRPKFRRTPTAKRSRRFRRPAGGNAHVCKGNPGAFLPLSRFCHY